MLACLGVVVAAYLSPLGRVRIRGAAAKPLLSRPRWFAVTMCTTIATGILFWGTAEPIYHFSGPPEAGVDAPAVFAMSTMLPHWTLTPYGMYTPGGLLFALAFYNRGQPFALSSLLEPLLGERIHRRGGAVIDAMCLFALVAGMAESNVSAMSALCVEGITPERSEAPLAVKLLWGGIIGTVARVMVAFAGVDGIRLVNTLGGFPAMLLFLLTGLSLLRLVYGSYSGADAGAKKG